MVSLEIRRQAIAELETSGREITPDILVEAARSPQHPLHNEFCWDADEAIRKLALEKAREIIRSVKVVITYGEEKKVVPLYVRNPTVSPRVQGYVATDKLRESREDSLASIEWDIALLENSIRALRIKAAALDVAKPLDEMLRQSAVLRRALGLRKAG